MKYIKGINAYDCPNETAVTLGKFDGLHRGHQKLIQLIKSYSDKNIKSVVCSFNMEPFYKEKGLEIKNLTTKEEKYIRLEREVDYWIECPFVKEIYQMEAEDFIKNILIDKFHARYIVVGTDFGFGHNRRGDAKMLEKYAEVYGYKLEVVEKETHNGREIGSTYIRELVLHGDVELAGNLLGYPYTIVGSVEHGKKLGRKLGFPTMNVIPIAQKLLPPNGVYVCTVVIDGKEYHGIGNIGCKPTVSDDNITAVETFLFGYDGEAYEQEIQIRLHTYVREERKFSSTEELAGCVKKDIDYAKCFFEGIR